MHSLKNLINFNNIDVATFFPQCYDLAKFEEQEDFSQEYKAIKAESYIKKFVRELRESAKHSAEKKLDYCSSSVKEEVVKVAIQVCQRRL